MEESRFKRRILLDKVNDNKGGGTQYDVLSGGRDIKSIMFPQH